MLVDMIFAKLRCYSNVIQTTIDLGLVPVANITADSRKLPSLVAGGHHVLVHLSFSLPGDLHRAQTSSKNA